MTASKQQRTEQGSHLKIRGKLQLVNPLKDLAQEGLNAQWVFGLTQYLQQLVIGQEIEARESQAFCLQVVIQALLNLQNCTTERLKAMFLTVNGYACTVCLHCSWPESMKQNMHARQGP